MTRTFWILFYLSLAIQGHLWGQNIRIDTLKAALDRTEDPVERGATLVRIATEYAQVDLEKMQSYIDQAAAISEYASLPEKQLKLKYMYGSLAERQNKLDTAAIIFQEIVDSQSSSISDSITLANTYYDLGNLMRLKGNTDAAIDNIIKSKELFGALSNQSSIAACNVVLGIIYKNSGLYDDAVKYYEDAYTVYEEIDHRNNMASIILNIANVRTRQKAFDEAIAMYEKALEISKGEDEEENLKGYVYGNLSNLYSQQKNFQLAHDYALQSYELRKSVAPPFEQINSLIGLANSCSKLSRPKEALNYLTEAESILAETEGLLESRLNLTRTRYKVELEMGRIADASESMRRYIILSDSLRNTELEKQALELNTKYETDLKEQEITLLNTENELQATRLKNTQRQVFGLILGFLVVGSLLFFVYRLLQKTKSQNEIIQAALAEKDILLREIHHRVKNNLQFISSLLGLQTEHIDDPTALDALQEGQDRVQSMALIHQNLYQEDNLTGVEVKDYFIKLIRNLFDSYNIRPGQVELDLNIETLNLDVDTVIPIGLIVNELVSNSLKYAFPGQREGKISVDLKERNDQLILAVTDDGIGMDQKSQQSMGESFGYRLIEVFKDQLQASLDITVERGTNVTMHIKKYRKVA